MCVCVCVCARASVCVCVCVRACVRACVGLPFARCSRLHVYILSVLNRLNRDVTDMCLGCDRDVTDM